MKRCGAHEDNNPWGACRRTPEISNYTVPGVKDQDLTSRAKAFNKVDKADYNGTAARPKTAN